MWNECRGTGTLHRIAGTGVMADENGAHCFLFMYVYCACTVRAPFGNPAACSPEPVTRGSGESGGECWLINLLVGVLSCVLGACW